MMNFFRLLFSKRPSETNERIKKLNQQILLGVLASRR